MPPTDSLRAYCTGAGVSPTAPPGPDVGRSRGLEQEAASSPAMRAAGRIQADEKRFRFAIAIVAALSAAQFLENFLRRFNMTLDGVLHLDDLVAHSLRIRDVLFAEVTE